MKLKKAKRRKRKLHSDEMEIVKPEKIIKNKEVDEVVGFIPDTMPTRIAYRVQIELGIRNRLLVLVKGPIGCGKTTIVKEVAKSMNLPCRTVQMGEQIDSKSLFGAFHCLDVPGEFCWKQSTFTKYLSEKGIILLEDIDCASADLISQIVDLCDNRRARVVSGELIQMHDEAYIVATMRFTTQERSFRSTDVELLLSSIPFEITLLSFTNEELRRAICILYGRVAPIARRLITIFNELISSQLYPINGRKLGAADLLKACARINYIDDVSDSVGVLRELIDVWTVHCQRAEDVVKLSEIIANNLSLNHEQLMYELNLRLPQISMTRTELTCGRVKLQREETIISKRSNFSSFGMTRDVCQLVERIAVCVNRMEPVLLVGETGVGKTAVVQLLANYRGANLRVINLSQHSDSSDLIGGYKPVSIPFILQPLKNEFDQLFAATFDLKKNEKFLRHQERCLSNGRYSDFTKLISETARRTLQLPSKQNYAKEWAKILVKAERCEKSLKASAVSFAYVRGAVAEAAERGEWLLVDEINLATPECLDSVVHLIEDPESRHPNFRLFACMNPASDIGKRNLPAGIRSRFTEIFVRETTEIEQLHVIAHAYLPSLSVTKMSSVLELYQTLRSAIPGKYSLRTLCRALAFTAENIFGNEARSLYEAVSMSFLSDLDTEAQIMVANLIQSKLNKAPISKMKSKSVDSHVEVEGYWIEKGREELQTDPKYVCTASVKRNLAQLARVVCSGKFPVLLEGETSCGKTAMVLHLAKITGNSIIRINNHEHTDLQEYTGSYVPDGDGRFVFMEGPLVKAAREGHWIILDELNLAPTDVIEAINRLLDDNRELFVPETNTLVKAHPRFRLFATQNPVASYAGRKRLSRALLNRFVVLRFDQLPYNELAQMVIVSCGIPPSAAQTMVSVFHDLRAQRSAVGVFSATDGLMTLRDLFRWGRRLAGSDENDWRQCLAEHGFFLLGSRCRNVVDAECVKKVLEKNLKREIKSEQLFAYDSIYLPDEFCSRRATGNIVLTANIRRMLVLVWQSWRFNEPALVIGETGCGKTTVAQMLAKEKLLALNCHERTEAADFLGSLRPFGDGTFQWMDGVVVQAMKEGRPVLIDEISLASDSVLERLNPLLEPSRSLFLNDAGSLSGEVQAKEGFNVVATMNPGGDYGKKELSKALRNRFTEIWCPSDVSGEDLFAIVGQLLNSSTLLERCDLQRAVTNCTVQFVLWFGSNFSNMLRSTLTIRDVVAVTELFIATMSRTDSPSASLYHAFSATLFDAFGTLSTRVSVDYDNLRKKAIDELRRIMQRELGVFYDESSFLLQAPLIIDEKRSQGLTVGDFYIRFGPVKRFMPKGFTFDAATCKQNVFRLVRGLALDKPILLEGPPGCGKSSTVIALAAVTGHPLTRLNLSEQTDLADLFGCDVPIVSSDDTPSFAWRDGPILQAIKTGQWVLLDEMNLASQSVLEGLNACFDHRRQLFIPELNRTFDIGSGAAKTRFFACQNPCSQGGNRRKLPKSFVNRFTSIYISEMDASDFIAIIKNSFGSVLSQDTIEKMVSVNSSIAKSMADDSQFLAKGSPFEFNLRDLLRWAQLTVESKGDVAYGFDLLYVWRLRSHADRQKMRTLFQNCFKFDCIEPVASLSIGDHSVHIGKVELLRTGAIREKNMKLLSSQMKLLEKLAVCVKMNWLTLIVGKTGTGKSTAVHNLASLVGKELYTMRLTSESDSLELLGSFEQVAELTDLSSVKKQCSDILSAYSDLANDVENALDLFALRFTLQSAMFIVDKDTANRLSNFEKLLSKCKMHFQWLNSRFVDAYVNGDWILIENVNCCSAAVLDRLNACLESNGELNLSECGDGTSVVKAHSDFRVFFTMDDDYGGVSRAMRNRSVELCLLTEDCAWFKIPQDALNIVMNSKAEQESVLKVVETAKLACEKLSCWELLKLSTLIKDMEFEDALKYFQTTTDQVVDGDNISVENFIVYPTLDKNLSITYHEWKTLVWFCVSQNDCMLGLLWAIICSPIDKVNIEKMVATFKCADEEEAKQLVQIIQNWKHNYKLHYDDRFDGPPLLAIGKPSKSYVDLDSFIIQMCALWVHFCLKKLPIEKGSAIEISCLFARKKIRSDQLISSVISYVKELVDELIAYLLKYCSVDSTIENSLTTLWNLMLFVEACHRQMNTRTACAPLHLAWQRLNNNCIIIKQHSINLCRIVNAIDNIWISDKAATERYTIFRKNCSIYGPFESYEQWKKYEDDLKIMLVNTSEKNIGSNEYRISKAHTNLNEHHLYDNGLLVNAINLMNDMCYSYAILKSFSVKEMLQKLSSVSSHRPPGLYHLAYLNYLDENCSRIAYFAQFLSSNFAVGEFVNAFKNSDLAWISLATEHFSPVWRSMGFKLSSEEVTLAQFRDFPHQRKRLCTYFWKIGAHLKSFKLLFRERLSAVAEQFEFFLDILHPDTNRAPVTISSDLMKKLESLALSLLPLSVPAGNCIDPVISSEINFNYLTNKKKMIENILGILQSYQRVVSGQTDLILFSNTQHPLIKNLLRTRDSVLSEIENYSEHEVYFRPRYTDFPSLVLALNSFLANVLEQHHRFASIDMDHPDSLSYADLKMTVAQIDCFLTSIQSFYDKTAMEYSAFPDIICPFFMIINVLVATVSFKRLHLVHQINLRNLNGSCDFPVQFKIEWNSLYNVPESDVLFEWCISEKSVMPKRLQKELIAYRIRRFGKEREMGDFLEDKAMSIAIQWIGNEWSKWFEANTEKQEKAYIYREKAKHEQEIDEDEIEIQEWLPDFSTSDDLDKIEGVMTFAAGSSNGCIDSENLAELLHLLLHSEIDSHDGHMALAWIMDTALSCGCLEDSVDHKFFVCNLWALNELNTFENEGTVDVYRRSIKSELVRCTSALKPLIERVHWLKEKWPEVIILDNILEQAKKILSSTVAAPQMQFSALLERLLSEAELWEKVADRKHSLANELEELRCLLLDWRKMEILCWDNLLSRVQTDSGIQTLLMSWPLFEACVKNERSDDDILAMTIEWIQNSTLIDFKIRLTTADLLIKFNQLLNHHEKNRFCTSLKSVIGYFQQFNNVVESKLAVHKEPIEKQLHDFVKIMKYNDLNLWSVKMSAQKAHQQLFRIIKQFKMFGNEPAAPLFDDLLPIPTAAFPTAKPAFENAKMIPCNNFYAKRAFNLISEIMTHLSEGINFEDMQELKEYVEICNELIRKDIQYDGEDHEKEKQQGRALSERQKAVSRLIKDSAAVGLYSRKGLTVNCEHLTADVVAGIPEANNALVKLIRHGGASRNIVLKKLHKPNAQINVRTVSHIKGLTEFILSELILCYQNVTSTRRILNRLANAKRMLNNHLENAKEQNKIRQNGQQWLYVLRSLKHALLKLMAVMEFMHKKLANAPENNNCESSEVYVLSDIQDTNLTRLHKQHPEYGITINALRKAQEGVKRLSEIIDDSMLHCSDCANIIIWKNTDIAHVVDAVRTEGIIINCELRNFSIVMQEEVEEAVAIWHEIEITITNASTKATTIQYVADESWGDFNILLIALQNAYKQAMAIEFNKICFMDIFKSITKLMQSSSLHKSVESVWELCAKLSAQSSVSSRFEQVMSISTAIFELFSYIVDISENCAIGLAQYYIHLEALAAVLLEKGYVNPIPKPQEEGNEKNGGKLQSFDDDIAGMGDAKGDKDVGDEIDETGQVEGLKGDDKGRNEDKEEKANDDGIPLDMEDDFGGNLEDIDREERSDNEGSDEDQEIEPEKEMGTVDQSEDDKLDPDLWDNENENEKNLDQDNKGANKTTDNIVADNEEHNDRNDKEGKEAPENEENNEMENVDERETLENDEYAEQADDECNVEDSADEKLEDDMENMMGDNLDGNEISEEGDEEENVTQTDERQETGEEMEDIMEERNETANNDKTAEKLEEYNTDEVIKGSAGGMDSGAPEDAQNEDNGSQQNVLEEEKNTDSENRKSATKTDGHGSKGSEKSTEEAMQEKCDDSKKNSEKSGKERKLAIDNNNDIEMHETPYGDGQQDDESTQFGHEDQAGTSLREQIVIDKSSLEEAKSTKAKLDQLKLQNLNIDQENDEELLEDMPIEEEVVENESLSIHINSPNIQNSIIHTSTDIYQLIEPTTSVSLENFVSLNANEITSGAADAEERWNKISDSVSILASELSENLRMIIEPTVASRFEGDYRTGKRLNMRRLITYIASGYRKDKIWLRRTKRAQHNYQILIAVDDSASMHDSQIKLKACQSVAMIEKGLRKFEIGQLAICKFGVSVEMISDFANHESSALGGRLISELNFSQDRTDLVNLLKSSRKIFEDARGRSRNDQMLIIVSDGRGVLADGAVSVKKALAELQTDRITVLFVAIDNGEKSISDMKVAEFTAEGRVNLIPYLQKFPFPFYVVVRHIAMLPATIGDAIRQWFELTARES